MYKGTNTEMPKASQQEQPKVAAGRNSKVEPLVLVQSPNIVYEPNDDGTNDKLPKGPCFVRAHFWEYTHDGF